MGKQLVATIQDAGFVIVEMDFKKDIEKWFKEVIDHLKLQSDKSFRAKEFQVLVATEAKEKGTHSAHLVFLLEMPSDGGHFTVQKSCLLYTTISSIWIVRP